MVGSNVLLVNLPSEGEDIARFLTEIGFKSRSEIFSSLDDNRLLDAFSQGRDQTARVDLVLVHLNGSLREAGRKERSKGEIRKVQSFVRRIRALNSTACVIVTGEPIAPEKVSALLRNGVYDYLRFPVSLKRLENRVRQGLRNRDRAEEIIHTVASANKKLAVERDYFKTLSHRLSCIHEINKTLLGAIEIDELISTFGQKLCELIPYNAVSIFLKGLEGEDKAWVWTAPGQRAQSPSFLEKLRASVIRSGKALLASSDLPEDAVMLRGEGEREEIAVPLSVSGEKVGLLRIKQNRKQINGLFYDYQRQLLSMVAVPFSLALRNALIYRKVNELAHTDPLTQVLNRRAFFQILSREFNRAARLKTTMALLLMDLDGFKKVNDSFGHQKGDQILQEFVALLKRSLRTIDILARYGGEEFVVIVLSGNGSEDPWVAERIRKSVEAHRFNSAAVSIPLTVSIGVALFPSSGARSAEELFRVADAALYSAKRGGRNRVEISSPQDLEQMNFYPNNAGDGRRAGEGNGAFERDDAKPVG